MVREPDGAQGFDGAVSRLRSDGTRDAYAGRRVALFVMVAEKLSRRDLWFCADTERAAGRRHRRARGEVQPRAARALPYRLGGGAHDRLPRLARPGGQLVRVDELSRPAPSVGPAAGRGAPNQLARSRFAGRLPRLAGEDRENPGG